MFAKLIILFGVVVLAMSAPSAREEPLEEPKLLLEPVDVDAEWSNWKAKHEKKYENEAEEANRFAIFKANLKKITEHNKKFETGEVSWSQGLNHFADLTQEEFAKTHLGGLIRIDGATGVN